jgi:predicted RNase H-like HicB family nuclease
MYRLGWAFAEFFASMGIPLLIKVDVLFDIEANVYVATSCDLKGLIVEAETLDELEKEVKILLPEILALNVPNLVKTKSTYCAFNQAPFAV